MNSQLYLTASAGGFCTFAGLTMIFRYPELEWKIAGDFVLLIGFFNIVQMRRTMRKEEK